MSSIPIALDIEPIPAAYLYVTFSFFARVGREMSRVRHYQASSDVLAVTHACAGRKVDRTPARRSGVLQDDMIRLVARSRLRRE